MEHAGFDGLHNPFGAMLVCAALLLVTAIMIFGAFFVKLAMRREKEVRDALRRAQQQRKDQ